MRGISPRSPSLAAAPTFSTSTCTGTPLATICACGAVDDSERSDSERSDSERSDSGWRLKPGSRTDPSYEMSLLSLYSRLPIRPLAHSSIACSILLRALVLSPLHDLARFYFGRNQLSLLSLQVVDAS